ncbi:hypothetical protein GC176_14305 [bacterium]|nr:hypothetical protein [bacterium]
MSRTLTDRLTNSQQPETCVCRQCAERLPLSSFRRRGQKTDLRHRECRQCHAANMRVHRQAKRQRDGDAILSEHLATLRHTKTLNQRLTLIDELNQRLGGPERVAELFHSQLKRVESEHRFGSVLRMLNQYVTLMSAVAQQPGFTFSVSACATYDDTITALYSGSASP